MTYIIACSISYNKTNKYSSKSQSLPGLKVSSVSPVHSAHNYGSTLLFSQLGLHQSPMTFFTSPAITWILLGISPLSSTCQDLFFLPVLLVQTQIWPRLELTGLFLYLTFVSFCPKQSVSQRLPTPIMGDLYVKLHKLKARSPCTSSKP